MTHNTQAVKSNRRTLSLATVAALAFVAVSSMSSPAHADDWHGGPGGHPGGPPGHYRHEEYRPGYSHRGYVAPHYRYADSVWHRGRWMNAYHDGRPGWWWVVNNQWFFYPQPVYPYPVNPYAPQEVYAPPVVVAPPPPPSEGFTLVVPLHIR